MKNKCCKVPRFVVCFVKVRWSRYRPGVAQRVGRGIALLFHDRCTRRGWLVSSTPRPHFTPGKDPVPILQEAGWAPGLVWRSGKSRPTWILSRTFQPVAQSLYRLSYPAPVCFILPQINENLTVLRSVLTVSLKHWIYMIFAL